MFGKQKKERHIQLKMCYLCDKAPTECKLPEGYSWARYTDESQKIEYVNICRNGLSGPDDDEGWFNFHIIGYKDSKPKEDVIFIKHGDEYVAAITAILHKNKEGYIHMVGVRQDYRGKGLSNPLNYMAVKKLYEQGAKYITLTTNDWRVPAVKGYLRCGFLPMYHGIRPYDAKDARKRWIKLLGDFGFDKYEMVNNFRKKFILDIKENNN